MTYGFNDYAAVAAGYGTGLGAWYTLTRWRPEWWPLPPAPRFARPGRELGLACLACVGVLALSLAFQAGALAWLKTLGAPRALAFALSLVVIWSPVLLTLALRRQGPETCFFGLRGLARKLSWALGLSLLALAAFLLVRGGTAGPLERALHGVRPVVFFQSLLQLFGFGFLIARLDGVLGAGRTSLVVGALYGLVKYPLYLGSYGLSWGAASALILFSALVAAAAVRVVSDRRDLLVPAVVHVFMDAAQLT